MNNKRILIGEIATTHGVKGLVKLRVFAENIDLFSGALYTSETGDAQIELTLKNPMKDHWLAELKDITNREDAAELRGTKIYVTRDALPDPEDGEMYYADLIGMDCVDEQGNHIGKIIDVQNFGAGDLLDIKPPSGESFYLPYTNETILDTEGKLTVHIPEGLLE